MGSSGKKLTVDLDVQEAIQVQVDSTVRAAVQAAAEASSKETTSRFASLEERLDQLLLAVAVKSEPATVKTDPVVRERLEALEAKAAEAAQLQVELEEAKRLTGKGARSSSGRSRGGSKSSEARSGSRRSKRSGGKSRKSLAEMFQRLGSWGDSSESEDSDEDEVDEVLAEPSAQEMLRLERVKLEAEVSSYPRLKSLEPEAVGLFLVEFDAYEIMMRETLNISRPGVARCISTRVRADMKQFHGVRLESRSSILRFLHRVRQEDQWARQVHLLSLVKEKVKWKNLSNPAASMRAFLGAASALLRGLDLDSTTEKDFCLEVIKSLPQEFWRGATAKQTQTAKRWKTWKVMRRGLEVEADAISYFNNQSSSLRVGTMSGPSSAGNGEATSPSRGQGANVRGGGGRGTTGGHGGSGSGSSNRRSEPGGSGTQGGGQQSNGRGTTGG